jgi:hypothetical protein
MILLDMTRPFLSGGSPTQVYAGRAGFTSKPQLDSQQYRKYAAQLSR